MTTINMLLKELEQEAQTTRKMLSRIPDDKFDWQPHPKSMSIRRLATHIADLPAWVTMAITTDELDFASSPYKEEVLNDTASILDYFERSLKNGKEQLEKADESTFDKPWTLRNGEEIYAVNPKHEVIRMTYCQIVHHRAQLGVYLRLLDVPIPGSYGPSADEMGF
ncbi:MAG: DinB family protein [Fimbriimonadaceae bacterium]|nr:DinB family protein [Chitinophagales bacterium]